ncbi:MAG: oligosaccharide flippase family protein, partial [Pseudomonadales bacterium]|nr:oligosaccharide flippase family protein [Pseudomonadales bacterium]
LLLFAVAPLVDRVYGSTEIGALVRIAAVATLVSGLAMPLETLLLRRLRFRAVALKRVVAAVVGSVLALKATQIGMGAMAVLALFLGAACINALLGAVLARGWPVGPLLPAELPRHLDFMLSLAGARVCGELGHRSVDLLIALLIGFEAAGLFRIGYQVVALLSALVVLPATNLILPLFSRRDDETRRRGLALCVAATSLVACPAFLAVPYATDVLFTLGFDDHWRAASSVASLLALVVVSHVITIPALAMLAAAGHPRLSLRITLLQALSSLLVVLLVSLAGGGLWAVTAAYVLRAYVLLALVLGILERALAVRSRDLLLASFGPLACAAFAFGCSALVDPGPAVRSTLLVNLTAFATMAVVYASILGLLARSLLLPTLDRLRELAGRSA